MDQSKIYFPCRLLFSSSVEIKDEFEEKLEQCYVILQNLSSGLSDKEAHDTLTNIVCKDKSHEEVCLGLLISILIHPENATKNYRDLTLVSRDGLAIVLAHLNQLVLEKYLKLNDSARNQLLWLFREMIRTNVTNVDSLCLSLLRHTAGGDISQRNLFLIDSLLDIFQENRQWLEKFPFLVASIVYTYLRLIEDHGATHLSNLRHKEVSFLVSLMRDRIVDCLIIGRDFVRLLQNVARIPEFEMLWKDILLNPKSLSPSLTGVLQLLQSRTSRRFLQSRLTPDMERKLVFLTSQVRFGNHKRYQEWFQRQYLATPESQTLRCDLIRFIVGVIHPTNELLCSDIIPRWAVIGWLFTTCTLPIAASNVKLALFYDWLFYESGKDNIMNIEPAILVMHNSMRSHPAVTATLLDFLCRIIPNFYPPLEDKVKAGIFSSLRQILEKRVLPSLYPLFDSPKLDRELRIKIRETFKEFCLSLNTDTVKLDENNKDLNADLFDSPENIETINVREESRPAFSDEDEDEPLRIVSETRKNIDTNCSVLHNIQKNVNYSRKKDVLLNTCFDSEELNNILQSLFTEIDNESRCQIMEKIVQMVIEDEIDTENIPTLALRLSNTISVQISAEIFPIDYSNDDVLTDSISTPLFVMFRNFFQLCKEEDFRKKLLARVLAELQIIQPKIGYLLLYFLNVWTKEEKKREGEISSILDDVKGLVYKDFCSLRDEKLDLCLLADLKQCHEDNIFLLCYLLPDIYTEFHTIAIGNVQLLHLVVSTIDSSQLQDLICQIMQGHLKMLKKESFSFLMAASLTWETFEQYCFWQIVLAHDFRIENVISVLPKLHFRDHAEALTSILLMLKQQRPTLELLKQLLSRPTKREDLFVVTALRYWYREYEEKLGELIANLLSTRFPVSPNKRKRSSLKHTQMGNFPTGEQLLSHLDQLRQHCIYKSELRLYQLESMQKALQQAQIGSSDILRKNFGDLFALAEINEETQVSSSVTSNYLRKNINLLVSHTSTKIQNKKILNAKEKLTSRKLTKDRITESSDETSEDEEILRPKQLKKRKKLNLVGSDSD